MKKTAAIILMLAVVMSCVLVAVPTVVTAQTGTTTPENLAHEGLIKTVYDFEGYADGAGLGKDSRLGSSGLTTGDGNQYLNFNKYSGVDFYRLNTANGAKGYFYMETGVTYTLTFKYKFQSETDNTFVLSLYRITDVDSISYGGPSADAVRKFWLDGVYSHSDNTPKEGEWYIGTVSITAPDVSDGFSTIAIGNNTDSQYTSGKYNTSSVYIDDFTISYKPENYYEKYTFDWLDDNNNVVTADSSWVNGSVSSSGAKIEIKGHRNDFIEANATQRSDGTYGRNEYGYAPFHALVYDPSYDGVATDVTDNDILSIKADKTYVITVTFTADSGAGVGIALGDGVQNTATRATVDATRPYSYVKQATGGKTHHITTIIDGSAVYPQTMGGTCATLEEYIQKNLNYSFASENRYVFINTAYATSGVTKYATIQSVDVYVFENSLLTGNIAVPLNPETGEPKMVAVYENGTTLYEEPNPEANAWGEAAEVTGDGAKVKGEAIDTLANHTVYDDFGGYTVSYPTVTMESEADLPVAPGTRPAGSIEIVQDDAAHGNVAKITTNTAIATQAHAYTTTNNLRFNKTTDLGKRFYVTMDVKLGGTIRSDMRFGIKAANPDASYDTDALGNAGNYATWIFVNGITSSASTKPTFNQGTIPAGTGIQSVTSWTTIGFSFDLTSDYFPSENMDLMFGIYNFRPTSGKDAYFYYDNVSVIEVTPGADNFSTGNATTNVMNSIRYESEDEGYQSAGLRFRATLPEGVAAAADDYGFVAVPAALATEDWYKAENWATSNALYKSAEGKHYGDDENTYQLLLSGLTVQDGDKNDVALETQIVAKMYVRNDDAYTYYDVNVTSYKEVKAAYRSYNTLGSAEEWAKY